MANINVDGELGMSVTSLFSSTVIKKTPSVPSVRGALGNGRMGSNFRRCVAEDSTIPPSSEKRFRYSCESPGSSVRHPTGSSAECVVLVQKRFMNAKWMGWEMAKQRFVP